MPKNASVHLMDLYSYIHGGSFGEMWKVKKLIQYYSKFIILDLYFSTNGF